MKHVRLPPKSKRTGFFSDRDPSRIKPAARFLIFAISLIAGSSLAGCTAYQVAGTIKKGRSELLFGDPKVALEQFHKAARLNPDYMLDFTPLPQGVWTYIGRAYYQQGKFLEARKALQQAVARHPDDNLARLYLGLVLAAREETRQTALKEIEAGFIGLRSWLDDMEQYHPNGNYWDPGKEIRKEIQRQLAAISRGKDINFPAVSAGTQWVGKELEEEIDRAKFQQWDEETRDGDHGEKG